MDLLNGLAVIGERSTRIHDSKKPNSHYPGVFLAALALALRSGISATRAFAGLLTAAGKKANVCVVVSDLAAAYQTGGALIIKALGNAKQELGLAERPITPVDLAANEIYDILRKRLFTKLPDKAEIDDIAGSCSTIKTMQRYFSNHCFRSRLQVYDSSFAIPQPPPRLAPKFKSAARV